MKEPSKLHVELLTYTPAPEVNVARAARLCYNGSDIEDLKQKMTPEKCEELLRKLTNMGHFSPVEHAVFTFGIEGVSRALTHQLVRHRPSGTSTVNSSGTLYRLPSQQTRNWQKNSKSTWKKTKNSTRN